MHRRSLISGLGAGGLVGLTGCTSVIEERVSELSNDTQSFGEPTEHRGVTVVPNAFLTTKSVVYDVADAKNTVSRSAPSGATFLLTRFVVEHTGENKRYFPKRGLSAHNDIKHFYKGERLSEARFENVSEAFVVNGIRLPCYSWILSKKNLYSAIYSGKATGWLINEIPEGFTLSETTVSVSWGGSSLGDDKNRKTFKWKPTSEAEIAPEESMNQSEESNTTIQM